MIRVQGRSVRSTLALALWGAALAVFVLAGVGLVAWERLTLEQRARALLEPYARLVAAGADAAVAFEDPQRAQEILDSLRAAPEILGAEIFLAGGRRLAGFGRAAEAAPRPPPAGPDGVTVGAEAVELVQALPHDGRLRLTMGLRQLGQQKRQLLWIFAAGVVVLLSITLIQLALLGRTIVRPIAALTGAAEGIRVRTAGALEVPAAGTDEVARLARSLGAMLGALREREEALERLNRELRAINDCNQLLVRAVDEQSLLEQVCRVVCEEAGYRMAWVGYAEQDAGRTIRPVAWAGNSGDYLAEAKLTWSEQSERGRGPASQAIRTGRSAAIQDFEADPIAAPWRAAAARHGYRAALALPLADGAGAPFGLLGIYSATPHAFTPDEVRLLERLAADLSFGVMALRTRIERERADREVVTLNRELERRVAIRTAQLELANRELEAFAYSVSHDLRAPLRHIAGFVALLQQKIAPALDGEGAHYLEAITDASKRMAALIEDLLAFSRMGRAEMGRTTVDLAAVAKDVIRELEPEAAGREVTWRVGELPVVIGDRAMLRLVLVNLAGNALKFTRFRPRAEIELGARPGDDGETIVWVRDNGVGFDMRYVSKLFGVFQRLHAREFEGTGIGLASVRRVIARHGGRTWAEGEVDVGAVFYFSLPRVPVTVPTPTVDVPPPPPPPQQLRPGNPG